MSKRHLLTTGGLAAAGLLLLAAPASAHISPTIASAPAGSYTTFSLQVPHGCGEGGTDKLEVKIPEDITSVTPEAVPGWTVTRTTEALDPPVDDGEGGTITERTDTVTWEGGPLPHDQLLLFGLSVKMPDAPGERVSFPVIQSCDNGQQTDWIEIPEAGAEEPEHPAPTIELTESSGDHHGDAAAPSASGDTSSDDDDGDGDGAAKALGITGIALGAVGIALGSQALRRSRQRS
jgi:uncharacterized protein YcnI